MYPWADRVDGFVGIKHVKTYHILHVKDVVYIVQEVFKKFTVNAYYEKNNA